MAYTITQAADAEPLTVSEVKYQLPLPQTENAWDSWIQAAISAARQYAETKTQRTFITSTIRQIHDCFPFRFDLETGPVQSVASVEYLDQSQAWQTVDPSVYTADVISQVARITPKFGQIWPIPVVQIASVRVNYVAGYGEAQDVPQGLKVWMKARIAAMWQNREEIVVGSRLTVAPLPFIDSMLDPYRVVVF